jgi:hypothetical protein
LGRRRRLIWDAFVEAKAKLPVIEVGILAIVAMYGMYLTVTGGVKKRVAERKKDGTYAETTEYASPEGPLGMVVKPIKRVGRRSLVREARPRSARLLSALLVMPSVLRPSTSLFRLHKGLISDLYGTNRVVMAHTSRFNKEPLGS